MKNTQEWESPCGVMAKVMDCGLKVGQFKLQWCYYIHFQINNLGKNMNPSIPPPSYGLNTTTTVFLQRQLWH